MNNLTSDQKPSPNLPQSYWRAVTQPNVETYQAEVPNASWGRLALSLSLLLIVNIVSELIERGGDYSVISFLTTLLILPIGFFGSALIMYGLGKLFHGKGATGKFSQDFMVYSYLLALIGVPFSILQSLLSFIPGVGGGSRNFPGNCLTLAISLYELYLTRQAIRVSQNLSKSSATWVVVTLVILLTILIFAIIIFAVSGYLGGLFSSPLLPQTNP